MAKEELLDGHVSGQSNRPLSRPAHALASATVVKELHADQEEGLSATEAQKRLEEFGRNELGDAPSVQPLKILIRQVANAMTLVLILAMIVSLAIKSWMEGGVIAAVVLLNIVVGFFQEFQAEKTMDSLRSLASPTSQTVRGGKTMTVPTIEVIPGDIVEVKVGDTIPADFRIIESTNFETDEALLTGESLPVRKEPDSAFEDDTGPGDRLNVAFSSSTVTKGRAKGVVFATGLYSEVGSIAAALRKQSSRRRHVKRKPDGSAKPWRYAEAATLTISDAVGHFLGVNVGTPLQKKLSRLACLLFIVAVICAIICLAANDFRNQQEVIIYAVATGLSMIPASLIVVLTITMAAGTKRMVQRHVIVRNLRSLEALGAVTDICSDKTGTLTQGQMVAKMAWIPSKGTYSVAMTNEPFNPTIGDVEISDEPPSELQDQDMEKANALTQDQLYDVDKSMEGFLNVAALANLAHVYEGENGWNARGDPTECAIEVFACRFGWNRALLVNKKGDAAWEELIEFPFSSDEKRMSMLMRDKKSQALHLFTKGAVERIITACSDFNDREGLEEMSEAMRNKVLRHMEAMASRGLRVLALASRAMPAGFDLPKSGDPERKEFEKDLTFEGLIGLYDPPRPESAASVRQCHEAGVAVHMLTGDHPGTARAIALEVGILPKRINELSQSVSDAMVMTAAQFDKLSESDIDALPVLPLVVARCAPSTKVRMIEALHRRGKFAAMTGDGVNDSPSLKYADVGIAMGMNGSDVAKDASDIVLTDDNFASILNAVEEGRRMFDNIQKFILHVLAENIAQALTLLIGLVFKDSDGLSVFPLAPVEILWIIMVTSGMPDMGLGFERKAPNIMSRPPVNLKQGVFSIEVLLDMLVYGVWTASLCIAAFVLVVYGFGDGNLGNNCNDAYSRDCDTVFRARATCFACLTWFALFLAWEMVSLRRSFFRMQPGSKRYFTQWAIDVWQNKFLFWAIIAGFVTIFPTLYIPVINHDVFKHTGISWEWGIVFVEAFLFFLGIELWKFSKRVYFRRAARSMTGGTTDVESKMFGHYFGDGGVVGESEKKVAE